MNILTISNASVHAVDTTDLYTQRNAARPAGRCSRGLRLAAGGAMLVSLLACGSMPGERAASGAGIGAGAGAAIGAVTGMGVGTGAAIGAAAGAATGGLTKEKDVNLGKPVWK